MTNKRILTLITLLLFLLLLVGCKAINQAPIITSIPITAVELGETYTYDVNATDPEGDTLTYSLITKPTGMTITSATGLIKWTPKAEGNYAVVVKVSDGVLDIIQSFTIVVSKLPDPPAPPPIVNYAPIITSIPGDTAIIGEAYLYDVNATDPNGDVLTYSLTKNPDDMTINSTTGLISWTPSSDQIGNNPVIVKVSDGKKFANQSFTITVKAVELTRIEVSPETITLFKGDSQQLIVTAHYSDGSTADITPYCIYRSSNPNIAFADISGLVMAGDSLGKAIIKVIYAPNGIVFTDTVVVTVIDLVHNTTLDTYHNTIQDAIDKSEFGNTIKVSAGTYEENVTIDESVTLQGEDRETTEIRFGHDIDDWRAGHPLTILADGVTVSGFTICSGPYIEPAWTIVVDGDSVLLTDLNVIKKSLLDKVGRLRTGGSAFLLGTPDNGAGFGGAISFTFTNSTVDSAWNCIYTSSPDTGNIVVRNVDFTYLGTYAIMFKLVTGATIEGNTFTNTSNEIGLLISRGCEGIEIMDNKFTGSASSESSHIGILLQDFKIGPVGVLILGNDIIDFDTGIKVEENVATSGISIHNNNIYNNLSYGINCLGLDAVDATNNWWGSGGAEENAGRPGVGGNNDVSANVDYEPWSKSEF